MSNRSRQTFLKRQKELARQERQRNKGDKRTLRRADKEKVQLVGGEDPDIFGIIPGPQALPWDLEDEPTEEAAEDSTEEETQQSPKEPLRSLASRSRIQRNRFFSPRFRYPLRLFRGLQWCSAADLSSIGLQEAPPAE